MVDLSDKVSESEDMLMNGQAPLTPERASSDGTQIKTCVDCGTSKTPLWRGGPAGPKSLCNACGIRSRKKRRALLGLNKEEKKPKKSITNSNSKNSISNNSASTSNNSSGSGDSNSSSGFGGFSLKRKLLYFGRDIVPLQRPRSPRSSTTSQRRKLGEVEQAAFLLMALSCGTVYA